VKWLINALAILFVGQFLPGIHVLDYMAALWAALVLGIINTLIRPLLFLITLPINIVTLGLLTFLINGLMFWLATQFVKNFTVDGFWWAVLGALIVSAIATVLDRLLLGKDRKVGGT